MSSACSNMLARTRMLCLRRLGTRTVQNHVRYASANTHETSERHEPTPVASPSQPRAKSAAAPGTVLKGIGYLQNQPQPIALPDEEYPSWLWTLLQEDGGVKEQRKFEVRVKGQSTSLNKREVRRKNKESIKAANFLRAQ